MRSKVSQYIASFLIRLPTLGDRRPWIKAPSLVGRRTFIKAEEPFPHSTLVVNTLGSRCFQPVDNYFPPRLRSSILRFEPGLEHRHGIRNGCITIGWSNRFDLVVLEGLSLLKGLLELRGLAPDLISAVFHSQVAQGFYYGLVIHVNFADHLTELFKVLPFLDRATTILHHMKGSPHLTAAKLVAGYRHYCDVGFISSHKQQGNSVQQLKVFAARRVF